MLDIVTLIARTTKEVINPLPIKGIDPRMCPPQKENVENGAMLFPTIVPKGRKFVLKCGKLLLKGHKFVLESGNCVKRQHPKSDIIVTIKNKDMGS
jgi:hypothetical protein